MTKQKIAVYGPTGFIGNRFCELYKDIATKQDKTEFSPKENNILYLISTVDNYNIHKDLHIDIDTNLKVLMNVLEHVKNRQDVVFNFVSSWFVYGQTTDMPFREDSECNPTGFYSITKYTAEQMLICFCRTFGIKYRILRLANVLGEGDSKISKKKNALQYLIKEAVNNRDLHIYDEGETIRDYIYVDDVCKAIKICIDTAPIDQIINIGNGRPQRLMDVIDLTIKKSNSKSRIINIETPKFHKIVQVRHSYLNTNKLRSYGFKEDYTIERIVDKLVEYYSLSNKE